ncbi:MAG: TIR domain-containing protein [Defluviitaleaceae bacterium]|nr:TIR domain-containing protein [Defluviitaleaceae bacterium]
MPHDVFISYSSQNKATADAVCHALERNGIRCWIAPRDIPAGSSYGKQIMNGIANCKLFLLLFSDDANRSEFVLREVERAVSYKKTIIPFRIEDVPMCDDFQFFLGVVHWVDAYPDDTLFDNLVTQIANILNTEVPKASPAPVTTEIAMQPESNTATDEAEHTLTAAETVGFTGKGKHVLANGNWYDGDWVNGVRTGRGKHTSAVTGRVYVGDFLNNRAQGKGILKYPNGAVYEGDFINNRQHGKGIITYPNGKVYEGDFLNNRAQGKGILKYSNGTVYEGDFIDNKMHGKGIITYPNGNVYEGDFIDNKRHGKGRLTWPSGTFHEGEYQDDKQHGKGVITYYDGSVKDGIWQNGEFIGPE